MRTDHLMTLSRRDGAVNDLRRGSLRDAHNYLRTRRDTEAQKKSFGELGLELLETAVGSGAVGYLAGYTGTTGIGDSGIPAGLVAGAVGYAATIFVPSRFDRHIHRLSTGAIAGFLTLWTAGQAGKAREAAGGIAGPIAVSGARDQIQGHAPSYAYQPPQMQSPPPAYYPPTPQMGPPPVGHWANQAPPQQTQVQRGHLSEAELQGISREMGGRP